MHDRPNLPRIEGRQGDAATVKSVEATPVHAGDERGEVRFARGEIGELRRNRLLLALAGSPGLLALVALVLGVTRDPRFLAGIFHPALFAAVLLTIVLRTNPRPRVVWSDVRASRSGIRIGERFVPRVRLLDGFYVPRPGARGIVRLRRRGLARNVELSVEGGTTGRRLLYALGFDATQTSATFSLPSRIFVGHRAAWLVLGLVAAMTAIGELANQLGARALLGLWPILFFAQFFVFLARSTVEVGTDGISVRWLGRQRFVPMSTVRDARSITRGYERSKRRSVVVTVAGGEQIELPVTQSTLDTGMDAMLVERILEAQAAARGGPETVEQASRLARGSRTVGVWVRDLRALGSGALATHRVAPVPAEQLWRVVEDAAASAVARAAAAVALGPTLDHEGRLRLKRAAKTVAAPRLRVALETSADPTPAKDDVPLGVRVESDPEAARLREIAAEEEGAAALEQAAREDADEGGRGAGT